MSGQHEEPGRGDGPGREIEAVLAIDPGREKCGLAVVSREGRIFFKGIVPAQELPGHLQRLVERYKFDAVILGDRTGSRALKEGLEKLLQGRTLFFVDEHGSTLEGRRRYLLENPPRGLARLIPLSLRTPPGAYDDYVAVVLAERFFRGCSARPSTTSG